MKYTKIVATIGPASDSVETISDLIDAGVNVFRFNMKHADAPWHEERIIRVKSVAEKKKTAVGVLIDLQGPEIRMQTFDHAPLEVSKNEEIKLSDNFLDEKTVVIPNTEVIEKLKKGDTVLIDDGFIELHITGRKKEVVIAKAIEDTIIHSRKTVTIPNITLSIPSLTSEDIDRLYLGKKTNVDFVALSYVRNARDVEELKKQMKRIGLSAHIVAKMESRESVKNLDEIIACADAVMVARGDLGVEVPFEQIAYWQETIVEKCRQAAKPVIVATQMLESMIHSPRPTRAEATDVANAVLDGTDAVMLSGETASGKYPLAAVKAMARIARFNEGRRSGFVPKLTEQGETELIVDAAMTTIKLDHGPNIDSIVVFTESGYTALALARYRPNIPIIAVTDSPQTVQRLTLVYGASAYLTKFPEGEFRLPKDVLGNLKKKKLIATGDKLLVVHGQHWNRPGQTNAIMLVNA